MATQSYVSKELMHFVGRGQKEEDQYGLLVKILKEGLLKSRIKPGIRAVWGGRNISDESMYIHSMVCFCDIPIGDLSIHMDKYSKFGLSFLKTFLVKKGANPVFYIANNSMIYTKSRLELFDEMVKRYHDYTIPLRHAENPWIPFFDDYILRYIKCYDESLNEDDDNNYYMEREWRILDKVEFNLDDVYRIILPESYSGRFREEFPEYSGKIESV